jgi:hypothetical protein
MQRKIFLGLCNINMKLYYKSLHTVPLSSTNWEYKLFNRYVGTPTWQQPPYTQHISFLCHPTYPATAFHHNSSLSFLSPLIILLLSLSQAAAYTRASDESLYLLQSQNYKRL